MRMRIKQAELSDLTAILNLQVEAYRSEAEIYNDYSIQPLRQTIQELEQEYAEGMLLKAEMDDHIIGSVRGIVRDGILTIGKLIVAPSHQNQGIGKKLMQAIESWPGDVNRFELFTGHKSIKNIALYERLGYVRFKEILIHDNLIMVYLGKNAR